MLIKMFKSKIHRATITKSDLHYEGSLTIDKNLMKAANIRPYESIWIWNINNGARLMTYALEGVPGLGTIGLNGSAARLGHVGDLVIISTFADVNPDQLHNFKSKVVLIDPDSHNTKFAINEIEHG